MKNAILIAITLLISAFQVQAEKIAVDSKGNMYVLGLAEHYLKFSDSTTIVVNQVGFDQSKTYLVKLDPLGNLLWYKLFEQYEEFFNIQVDHSDNLVLACQLMGTIALDSTTVLQGTFRALIARFDPAGNLLWYNLSSESANKDGISLSIDANNNIYTSSNFSDTFHFNGPDTIFTKYPVYKPFIAKFDSSGNNSWLQKLDSWRFNVFDLDVDELGNFVMVGGFQDSIILQGDTLYSRDGSGYWAKFDTNGDELKIKQIRGSIGAVITEVGTGKNGHFSYVGFFRGDTLYVDDFPPTLPTTAETGNFVAHVNYTDTETWLLNFNGIFGSDRYGIEMDSTNNTYLYTLWEQGYYYNPFLNSFVGADLSGSNYVVKMDSAGNFLCFLKIYNGQLKDIEIQENGQIYLVANFEDFLILNDITYTQSGHSLFIAAFDFNCSTIWTSLISNPVTGVHDSLNIGSEISIFPNPATHTTTLSLRDSPVRSGKIILFNIEGKPLMELKFSDREEIELNIEQLSSGMFILQIITDDHKQLNYKIVKI